MTTVKNYLSLVKFSHTIFAMPFAFIGFFLAAEHVLHLSAYFSQNPYEWFAFGKNYVAPSPYNDIMKINFWVLRFSLVILCMIFARSAAMAFNRWLDAKYDALNPRTAIREIPTGVIRSKSALVFTIGCCILFVVSCFFINRACFYLSPVALFIVLFYSYTKRFTALCHLVLGVGLSLAPIGAYIAVTGQFALLPILFSFTVLFWVSGFDIIYALQDEEFDRTQQLHSIPAAVGKVKALRISEMLHVLSAAAVITAGFYGHFSYFYWAGVIVFISMLFYQHSIVKPNDLRKVNIAFMTANGIASIVFAVFVLLDIFLGSTFH